MAKHPGQIMQLPDQRKCIVYNDQPLFAKGKIIFHLLNEDLSLTLGDDQKQKVLIKSKQEYVRLCESGEMTRIGYVD